MSLHSDIGSDGYYDDKGHWQRTKFCFMPCVNCTCGPPGGMWVIPVKKKDNTDEDKEMTTRNAQNEENKDS